MIISITTKHVTKSLVRQLCSCYSTLTRHCSNLHPSILCSIILVPFVRYKSIAMTITYVYILSIGKLKRMVSFSCRKICLTLPNIILDIIGPPILFIASASTQTEIYKTIKRNHRWMRPR